MASFFEKLSGAAGSLGKLAGSVSPFVSAGIGIAQAFKGAKQAKQAREARQALMDNRQELRNITEGMRVSTLGAELQTQEAQRRFATSVDALRSGGVRGLVGGLGQMEQQQQFQQQQISADLDRQQQQIEMMGAQDQARIREMQESREEFNIGVLAGEEASGRERMMQGIGVASSSFRSMVPEAGDPRVKDIPKLSGSSAGVKLADPNNAASYITQPKRTLGEDILYNNRITMGVPRFVPERVAPVDLSGLTSYISK